MAKIPKSKVARVTSYSSPSFLPYVTALGQLALSWNFFHQNLALLFVSLLHRGGSDAPLLAVWHSLKADRAQRDALLAAAETLAMLKPFEESPALATHVKWLHGQANALEDLRNDSIHTPLWAGIRSGAIAVYPITGLGHVRARKLNGKNLLKEYRYCRDATATLTNFSVALTHWLNERRKGETQPLPPWPARPSLPNRGDTTAKKESSSGSK